MNTANKEYSLYNNTLTTRISDPGEEGSYSHLFETTVVELKAKQNEQDMVYCYTKTVENRLQQEKNFTDLNQLFKFLGESLDPVSLGQLAVKIGKLLA